jgi:hypothetical protein
LSAVEWTRRCLDELDDAATFYDGRQPGLGDAFLAAALEVGKRIAEHPRAFAVVGGEFAIMPELVSQTDLGNATAKRIDRGSRVQVMVRPRISLA